MPSRFALADLLRLRLEVGPPPHLIHRSAWKRNSPQFAWRRPNTYERPLLRTASCGYYPDFLIIPAGSYSPSVAELARRTGAMHSICGPRL
jgi:hypothetical protein